MLLGDDGVGPYVLEILQAFYSFGENVELVDLGTPALDLTHRIVGLHSVILIDSVASGEAPGTITLYRKEDIFGIEPAQRLDPHSPALSECLLTAEMMGATPDHVLLVGIAAACCEPGPTLSPAVEQAVAPAIAAVLEELQRLGYDFQKRANPAAPGIWWSDGPHDLLHALA